MYIMDPEYGSQYIPARGDGYPYWYVSADSNQTLILHSCTYHQLAV